MLKKFKYYIFLAIFLFSFLLLVSVIQANDSAYTDDQQLFKKAIAEQDITYCQQLQDMDIDQCIYLVVTSSNNESFCQEINRPELKAECLNFIVYQQALSQSDISLCLPIEQNDIRNKCLNYFFNQQKDVEYCQNFTGQNQLLCLDNVYKNIAIANNDLRACDNINQQSILLDCQTIVKNQPQDSDNDGITDMMERSYSFDPFLADTDGDGIDDLVEASQYKTNARLADTDGDGISDGEEIASGSDPKDATIALQAQAQPQTESETQKPMKITNVLLIVVGVLLSGLVVLLIILKFKR